MNEYITVGLDGEKIYVESCLAYTYSSGNGKTVLIVSMNDIDITKIADIVNILKNQANKPIYHYAITDPYGKPVGNEVNGLGIGSIFYNFCKSIEYKFDGLKFIVEIEKRPLEEIYNEENKNSINELMSLLIDEKV